MDGVESGAEDLSVLKGACQADTRDSGLAAALGDVADAFAHEAGFVERTFAGDDEVGFGEAPIKGGVVSEQVAAGDRLGLNESHQGEAETPGGSRPGLGGVVHVEVSAADTSELAQGSLGALHIIRAQTFLRAVNAGGAPGTEQEVLDVDRDGDVELAERSRSGRLNGVKACQVRPSRDGTFRAIKKGPSEGAGHTEPAVVGGAAADADEATSSALLGD
jgi:hypothetical protein